MSEQTKFNPHSIPELSGDYSYDILLLKGIIEHLNKELKECKELAHIQKE